MKSFWGRCIFAIIVLTFGLLNSGTAQNDTGLSEGEKNQEMVLEEKTVFLTSEADQAERQRFYETIKRYSPVKAYIERMDAVTLYCDFDKAWRLTADYLKQEAYNGSFEYFTKFPERMIMCPGVNYMTRVEFITPEKVKILLLVDVAMVKEKGEWKFSGNYEETENKNTK